MSVDLREVLSAEGERETEAKIEELKASGLSAAAQQAVKNGMADFGEFLLQTSAQVLMFGGADRQRALIVFYDFLARTCGELRDKYRRVEGVQ